MMGNAEQMFMLTGFPAFLMMLVVSLLWVIPLFRILPRFGFSKWLACLGFIPVVGPIAVLILLWILAFSEAK